MDCKHKRCQSQVRVVKPRPGDDDGVWMAMIRVRCGDCGTDFRFSDLRILVGQVVPAEGACMSADALEAFLRITPIDHGEKNRIITGGRNA